MASVPFSRLTGSTLREALRESIKESRKDVQEKASEALYPGPPPSPLMKWVTEKGTGRRGWVVQELNYGYHLRIRWEGARGAEAVSRVRIDDIEFDA